jgi:hypothetical protein
MLRRIYGPVVEQGLWRISTKQELRELYKNLGHAVEQLVELRYMPEGRGLDSRWGHCDFSLT